MHVIFVKLNVYIYIYIYIYNAKHRMRYDPGKIVTHGHKLHM